MDVTSKLGWQSVASLYDVRAAHSLAVLLEDEAVPTQETSDAKLIGEALVWEVWVPVAMLERAHQLLGQSRFTDAELEYLATGVLAGVEDPK
jgi:hypothetical protein